MRRHTPGVLTAREMLQARIAHAETADAEKVIRALEPFVLERRRQRLLEVIAARLESVTVLFDAPHDPHNGAAVIRSCEAFGVQFVHVVERTEHFLAAPSVARGSQKWIDVVCHTSAASAIAAAREMKMELVSTHPEGELLPTDLARIGRVAIVLGNERDGITDDLGRACTRSVRVPMRGFIESLNVSVTAAILLAAATDGRAGDLDRDTQRRLYARGLYHTVDKADEVLADAGIG
jgi:tRNA (guanosine-2'-O-)-methyltransferase